MDELRADGESRFSRLLKELPAEVLAAYRAREAGPGDLMDVRTEAVRRLEKKPQARSEIHELAAFAEREALLKRAREAGLTAREHELLGLVVGDADRFFRNGKLDHGEAARELGIAVGTVKSLWSRIRKTLNAA
jgi:DNA-binding CsgD family transcriptional regulator